MARLAAALGRLKRLSKIFLIFFGIFTALTLGVSFIYQPILALFYFLPFVPPLACFAIVATIVLWQSCIEEVPSNTVGLVSDANGRLKALASPGKVWVWIIKERLSGFISLEPTTAQLSLLGLKSSDEAELAPLVIIITWRVHASITTLLSKPQDEQQRKHVLEVATASQGLRERRVRDTVAEVLSRHVAYRTLAELEEYLPNLLYNDFGEDLIADINQPLNFVGLSVEKLECIGSITIPIKASAAVKTIGAAHTKLKERWQISADSDAAPVAAVVPWEIDELLRHARQAVQDMQAAIHAVDAYVQAVIAALKQGQQDDTAEADLTKVSAAQKAQSERLTALATEINSLLEAADAVASQPTSSASWPLTEEERGILLTVLKAIEQKKVSLESIFA